MKNKIIGILSILLTIIIITGCEKNTLDLNDINTVTFGDLSFEIPKAFEKASGGLLAAHRAAGLRITGNNSGSYEQYQQPQRLLLLHSPPDLK